MVGSVFSIKSDSDGPLRLGRKQAADMLLSEYIGGAENILVATAVDAVLQDPPRFNPIVFFGPVGTGKSLLVQLIVARSKRDSRSARTFVITGADFAREYAHAIETDSLPDFRAKCRRASLLAIDDLHEIGDKRGAQNELVRTIDAMVDSGRRVVATLPQSPAETSVLLPGLASRLGAGLSVPLEPPGPAARRRIVRSLATTRGFALSRRVVDLIASDALADAIKPPTVPRLLQTLVRLEDVSFDDHPEINAQHLRRYLQPPPEEDERQLKSITQQVSKYFKLRANDLRGKTRQQRVVRARGVAMFLARRLTGHSLEYVGRHYDNRDHTTILHACRKIESLLETEPAIRQAVTDLTLQLNEP